VIVIVLYIFLPILDQIHVFEDIGPQKMAGRTIKFAVTKPRRGLKIAGSKNVSGIVDLPQAFTISAEFAVNRCTLGKDMR